MRENLKKYLQSLFADAASTPNNDALFEELLGNLYDRYDELIAAGDSPDVAYARAIGDLGDISPLFEKDEGKAKDTATPTPPPFYQKKDKGREQGEGKKRRLPAAQLCTAKIIRGAGIAVGVMLCILWLVLTAMFDWVWPLFVFAALGTVVIVLTCNLVPDFADDSEVSYAPAARKAFTLAANLLQAFGIGFCVLCVLPVALIDNQIGAALMFAVVALGVGMIIFSSAIRPRLDKELEEKVKTADGQWYERPEESKKKKKRNWIVPIVVISAVLILLGVGIFVVQTQQYRMWFGTYSRSNPALYVNAGNAVIDEEITRLSLEWDAGSVTVEPYGGDRVEIVETEGGAAVSDTEEQLHWYVENGHLRIRFDGKRSLFFRWGNVKEKHLTVRIPVNSVPFTGITVNAISASLEMKNLSVKGAVDVNSISGTVNLYAISATSTNITTVSGNIVTAGSDLGKLSIDTASAVTVCRDLTATGIDFESVSGDLSLENASFEVLDADTTSGDARITLATPATKISFDTTSGDLHIKREGDFGFIIEFGSINGDFDTDLPVNHNKGYYRYGDESMRIEMDATSGDLTVE